MWCNQIFSLLYLANEEEKYIIGNIIVADNYEIASQIARMQYGADAIAIDTTRYPLKIGDTYENGTFISAETGEEIKANPTELEKIKELEEENSDRIECEAEILYELSLLQLGLI